MRRFLTAAMLLIFTADIAWTDGDSWQQLEPGLELRTFSAPMAAAYPNAEINVLRIDPAHFELKLLNASAAGGVALTPKQWAQANDLVAVINASMFQADLLTSVSLMRTGRHVNNAFVSRDKTILGFNPVAPGLPAVKLIDRECDDFDAWRPKYATLVQSIRMISCRGKNVWRAQSKKSSASAIGIDRRGNLLFIQTETKFVIHDLINLLLEYPIDIVQAMYTEGGPQAQLFVKSGGHTLEFTGHFNPFFGQSGGLAWPLPNVIGIVRR